jgi:hypothetical protein
VLGSQPDLRTRTRLQHLARLRPRRRGARVLRAFASLLAVLAMLGVRPAAAATLCFGDDGHIAVERVVSGHCDSHVDAAAPLSGADGLRRSDCCGPCTDLAFASGLDLGRRIDALGDAPRICVGCMPTLPHAAELRAFSTCIPRLTVFALRDRTVLPLVLRC